MLLIIRHLEQGSFCRSSNKNAFLLASATYDLGCRNNFLTRTDEFFSPNCLIPENTMQFFPTNSTEIEQLYRRYGSALVLFAASITGERARAQDAVHQVFLRLMEGADLRHVADAKAYLFASVRNTVLNDVKVRQRTVLLDSETGWFESPGRDPGAGLDLQKALSTLPNDQREVMVLHVWGELTFSQVAEVLGISPNTAASRYRYALARLRDAMCAEEEFRANS